jgi:hypothetical protein
MRADSAVEPTKSENITVTWRRSAVSWGFSSTVAGCGTAGLPSSWIAASIFRRCPSRTPIFLEVLIRQVTEDRNIDPILGKTLRVLGHSELFEPVRNLLHCDAPRLQPD